jgi:chaperone required for assembly of F1-ATPase
MTSRPKRFYTEIATKDDGGGVSLLLDGRPVRTPGKAPLVLPTQDLAEAVAQEWRAQGARIDPSTMPLTKLANSALDGVSGQERTVIDEILGFAGADLLCYRAEGPDGLVALQTKHWDPVLAWAKEGLDAPFEQAHGGAHIAQPQSSLDRIGERLGALDAFSLAALHVMTALTGSAVLALAVALGQITPEAAWEAAHVDEDWQISQWGEDAEAATRRESRLRDFQASAKMLALLRAKRDS